MPDSTWKRAERRAAAAVGGRRTGNRGKAAPDVVADWCVVEVKTRAALPAWIKRAMRQSENAAAASVSPRSALVELHEVGARYDDDLIIMRASEFRELHGEYGGLGEGVN
jgi:hypothetical protein